MLLVFEVNIGRFLKKIKILNGKVGRQFPIAELCGWLGGEVGSMLIFEEVSWKAMFRVLIIKFGVGI